MKVITWNVNGIKSLFTNPVFEASIKELVLNEDPDIILFQETRCPVDLPIPEWFKAIYPCHEINVATSKKGYSGVGYFAKSNFKPIDCQNNVIDCLKDEGRSQVITVKLGPRRKNVKLLNLYVPNSKPDLARLNLRVTQWEPAVTHYLKSQNGDPKEKLIVAGDLNVTPSDADLYRKAKKMEHCNTPEERSAFATLLSTCALVDTYRELQPFPSKKDYTWFSNFGGARAKGNGWRIDFVLAPKKTVTSIRILQHYVGSDHVPILFVV
jgi:exodeoxyribonuclease-3